MTTPPVPLIPWYKKKLYIISFVIIGIVTISSLISGNTSVQPNAQASFSVVSQQINRQVNTVQTNIVSKVQETTSSGLSNSNYYTNIAGNTVHSPAYSNIIPVGASARCGDGTYSFSQSRRGTCSHHGGVASWL